MSSLAVSRNFSGLVPVGSGRAAAESEERKQAEVEDLKRRIRAETETVYEGRIKEIRNSVDVLVRNLEESVSSFMDDFEKKAVSQIIELSMRIAENVLRSRLPDREMTADIIRKTLSPIMNLEGVKLKLSAGDAAIMREYSAEDLERILKQVDISVDDGLKAGDVVVESRNGYFNAKIDERIKLLDARLRERCGNVSSQNK